MGIDLNEFKFSQYNKIIQYKENIYMYNGFTGAFGKVDKKYTKCIQESNVKNGKIPIELREDEKFVQELISGGFIIYEEMNENDLIKSIYNMNRFGNKSSLSITIVPTTGCNFRCTYCFEKEQQYRNIEMSPEIIEKTIEFIRDRSKDNGTVNISWFGGEPLLKFDIINKIQTSVNEMCKERNIKVSSNMITNGYLLTKNISDQLNELGINNLQITIDGSEEIHNKQRKLINGKGTYDKIIHNILECNPNIVVSIRININRDNILHMDKFFDDIKCYGLHERRNLIIYFAVVKDHDTSKRCIQPSCYNMKEFSQEELKLYKLAYKKGIKNAFLSIDSNIYGCAAVSPNSFVIEPDGTIQKCWNLIGKKSAAIDSLIPEEIEKNKDKFQCNQVKWYSWDVYQKNQCKECKVLPLCMGGCPYYDIYTEDVFIEGQYSCSTKKFNLDNTLETLACAYEDRTT